MTADLPKTAPMCRRSEPQPSVSPHENSLDPLLQLLNTKPLTLDELSLRCGLGVPALQAQLLALELAGRVTRLPGGLYQTIRWT